MNRPLEQSHPAVETAKRIFDLIVDLDTGRRHSLVAELADADPEVHRLLVRMLSEFEGDDEEVALPISPASELAVLRDARFDVRRVLGTGAYGSVYEVWDKERSAIVALKMLHRVDPDSLLRFKREFRTLRQLRHPNLVRLYQLFGRHGSWYYTMEMIDGVSLVEYVRHERHACDIGRLHDVFGQLIAAVSYLHRAKYLHRDLKPSNVLVTHAGQVFVLDFGVVQALESASWDATNSGVGTPAYMAPEQIDGASLSPASDAYAIGTMLFEALTGRLPRGHSFGDVLRNLAVSDLDPRSFDPHVPDDLRRICLELLRPVPKQRPTLESVKSAFVGHRVDGPPTDVLTAPVGKRPPFVGRAVELQRIADALTRVRRGRFQLVLVTGPAGIGKTALLEHALAEVARGHSALILRGRCHEHEAVPYQGIDVVIDELAEYLGRLPDAAIQRLLPRDAFLLPMSFPVLGRVRAIAAAGMTLPLMPDPQEVRQRTFMALRELLGRIADQKLTIVWIDDMQWSDRDTIALLNSITDKAAAPPLLLVLALRNDDQSSDVTLSQLRALIGRESPLVELTEIDLGRLTLDESAALLSISGVKPSAAAAILAEAAGHPFYLRELSRAACKADAGGDERLRSLTLNALIQERLRSIAPAQCQLVELVSVAGQPLPEALFLKALNPEAKADADVVDRPVQEHLIRVSGDPTVRRLEVFHDLVRSAVLESMTVGAKRLRHAQLAAVLQAVEHIDPATLVFHHREAGQRQAAHEAAINGARAAEDQLAFDHASLLYRAAVDTADDATDRSSLLRRLAESLANAGRGYESARTYLVLADSVSDPDEASQVRRLAADQLMRSGHLDEALGQMSRLLSDLGIRVPHATWAIAARIVAGQAVTKVRLWGGVPQPIEGSRRQQPRLDVLRTGALILNLVDPVLAAYFQTRYIRDAIKIREPMHLATALAIEGSIRASRGARARHDAIRLINESERIARMSGSAETLGIALLGRAFTDYLLGEVRDGLRDSECAIEHLRLRCIGVSWELTAAYVLLVWFKCWAGELREATALVPALLKEASTRDDVNLEMSLTLQAGWHWCRLADDKPAECIEECRQALARTDQTGFHFQHITGLAALIDCRLYAGDLDGAFADLTRLWEQPVRALMMRWAIMRVGLIHIRARVYLSQWLLDIRDRKALGEVRRYIDQLDRVDFGWAMPIASALRSAIAGGHGDVESAAAHMKRARAGYESLHLQTFANLTRYASGILAGGRDGQVQVREALSALSGQGIRNPNGWMRMMFPGPWAGRP